MARMLADPSHTRFPGRLPKGPGAWWAPVAAVPPPVRRSTCEVCHGGRTIPDPRDPDRRAVKCPACNAAPVAAPAPPPSVPIVDPGSVLAQVQARAKDLAPGA